MTMVERVARAMCAADAKPLGSMTMTWESISEAHRDTYWKLARAAIEAMREPTDEMKLAGFRVNVFDNRGGCPGVPQGESCDDWHDAEAIDAFLKQTGICRVARVTKPANDAWRAMIDAALNEEPAP